jgi:hypothetical protein
VVGRAPEPRAVIGARPGSPGPQVRGGRGSRARDRSSEDHLGISRISGSSAAWQSSGRAASAGGESPERIGQSRAATRPQPAELRQDYQTWPGATRIPERSGARANMSSFGHSRQTGPRRPIRLPRHSGELRARAPPGVLTCSDPFGAP